MDRTTEWIKNSTECHQELERSDSSSTVSSSVAVADIRQQIQNLTNSKAINPRSQLPSPSNMKFENVESLSIVYHNNFCNHTSMEGIMNPKIKQRGCSVILLCAY